MASPENALTGAAQYKRRISAVVPQAFKLAICAEFAFLLTPLLLASLARPLGLWDYLTAPALYLPNDPLRPLSIVTNYWHNVFRPMLTVRPTTALILNLQYVIFGGEFWLWYLVRWLAKGTAVLLVDRILLKWNCELVVRIAVAAFLLFNPISFELMLLSSDGWLTLFILAFLAVLLRFNTERPLFDISGLDSRRYAVLFIMWFLTMGVKEAGIAFAAAFMCASYFSSPKSLRLYGRLVPFFIALTFWVWKLRVTATSYPSSNMGGGSVGLKWRVMLQEVRYMIPDAPLHGWFVLAIAIAAVGLYRIYRSRDRRLYAIAAFAIATALGSLVVASFTLYGAPRYATAACYLLALVAGLGLTGSTLPVRVLAAGFALVFPLAMVPDIYTQALAYQQNLYEAADTLAALRQKAAEGYTIALTGDPADIPMENQRAIRIFFEQYGPRLYDLPRPAPVVSLSDSPILKRKTILAARFTPADVRHGRIKGITMENVQDIFEVQRGGYGVLDRMAAYFAAAKSSVHWPGATTFDFGSPLLTADPKVYLYVLSPVHQDLLLQDNAVNSSLALEFVNYTTHTRTTHLLVPGTIQTYRAATGEVTKLSWPLPFPIGQVELAYSGKIRVTRGNVVFGVTDEPGHNPWNVLITAKDGWQDLPAAPPLKLDPGTPYFLFFYNEAQTGGVEYTVKDISIGKLIKITPLLGTRRYGAMAW